MDEREGGEKGMDEGEGGEKGMDDIEGRWSVKI